MTTYELRFAVERWASAAEELAHAHLPAAFFRVPLACIDKIEHRRALDGVIRVALLCKDARAVRLVLTATTQVENAIKVLLTYAFPGRIEFLFAFNHRLTRRRSRRRSGADGGRDNTRGGGSADDPSEASARASTRRAREIV
jgi:hypothetical protein